jgi:hypothetical protein
MADLVAHKRVTYAGRVYRPGVAFSASPAHARVLVACGMAGFARESAPRLQTAAGRQVEDSGSDLIDVLRAAYKAKAGKPPDSRWREKRLTKEIAAL